MCRSSFDQWDLLVLCELKGQAQHLTKTDIATLTRNGIALHLYPPCQRAGRPRGSLLQRGKSGLHGTTVPGNARRCAIALSEGASGIVPQKAHRLASAG